MWFLVLAVLFFAIICICFIVFAHRIPNDNTDETDYEDGHSWTSTNDTSVSYNVYDAENDDEED